MTSAVMRFFKNLVVGAVLASVFFTTPVAPVVYAATNCADNPNNIIPAPGGLPTVGCGDDTSKIELVMKLVFGALAMFSFLFIVIGGLKYTLSGGDSTAIASAKKTILYAVIGLVLGVSTFTIISLMFSWIGA